MQTLDLQGSCFYSPRCSCPLEATGCFPHFLHSSSVTGTLLKLSNSFHQWERASPCINSFRFSASGPVKEPQVSGLACSLHTHTLWKASILPGQGPVCVSTGDVRSMARFGARAASSGSGHAHHYKSLKWTVGGLRHSRNGSHAWVPDLASCFTCRWKRQRGKSQDWESFSIFRKLLLIKSSSLSTKIVGNSGLLKELYPRQNLEKRMCWRNPLDQLSQMCPPVLSRSYWHQAFPRCLVVWLSSHSGPIVLSWAGVVPQALSLKPCASSINIISP
jgi:hypothetical protein